MKSVEALKEDGTSLCTLADLPDNRHWWIRVVFWSPYVYRSSDQGKWIVPSIRTLSLKLKYGTLRRIRKKVLLFGEIGKGGVKFWKSWILSLLLHLRHEIQMFSKEFLNWAQMPDFATARSITATTCKILSTTRSILALTWFCHLSMYLWSLGGGLRSPKEDPPPYTWKNFNVRIDF